MSGPLIYRRWLFVGSEAFDPNTLSPDYFDNTERTFDGTSGTVVNTGIYNDFALANYSYVYISFTTSDGQPAVNTTLIGGRSAVATTWYLNIRTNGTLRVGRASSTDTTGVVYGNGVQPKSWVKVYTNLVTSETKIYKDGTLLNTFGSPAAITAQNTRPMFYGALNNNGAASEIFTGTGHALFVWSGSSDLSSQDITNLDNYFAVL